MKYIVITTINAPTPAVVLFSELTDHHVVAVGDAKTPNPWTQSNVEFLDLDAQAAVDAALANALPLNHYSRKMLGYVHAIRNGATVIIDTDDDNLPKPGYRFPPTNGEFASTRSDLGFINPYRFFTEQRIWPRGYPLDLLQTDQVTPTLADRHCRIGVWQGLADGDPDVDAIYRLTTNVPCLFEDHEPVALGAGTVAPFNSQNTMFTPEAFPLLFLPATVTFRFTDVLRGLVAQPIMWADGLSLGFCGASVTHLRNEHDYFEDFLSEIPMYQHTRAILDIVGSAVDAGRDIPDNLRRAYAALVDRGIVQDREMALLDAWLRCCERRSV